MKLYLAYLEHDCGCRDTTVVGVYDDYESASKAADLALSAPENSYFVYCGVKTTTLNSPIED